MADRKAGSTARKKARAKVKGLLSEDDFIALLDPTTEPARRGALRLLFFVEGASLSPGAAEGEPRDRELARLRDTLACANCGEMVERPSLYCHDLCKQKADVVRYTRGSIDDGRIHQVDVQEAVGTKLLMVTGGGYPARERIVPKAVREAIFERDRHVCVLCGAAATEIDHIRGNSNDPTNLRAVCRTCNIREAFENSRKVNKHEEPELYATLQAIFVEIASRIAAPLPLRACDDHDEWNEIQKALMSQRRARFRNKNENP